MVLPALVVLAVLAGLSLRGGPGSGASAGTAEPPPARPADEAELDRLIEVFTARSADRGQSLEHRFLGSLLLQRAQARADVTDYRRSTDAFTRALQLTPDDRASLLGQGQAALGIHDFETARRAAGRLLELDPEDEDGLALDGDAAFAVGDHDAASTRFDRLAEARPDDPAILVRRSQAALVDGRAEGSERAIDLANRAVAEAERQTLTAPEVAFQLAYTGPTHIIHSPTN
jgi:tetratricopeptide (TPR) repeat protein